MGVLQIECEGYGPLRFWGDRPRDGHDRFLQANSRSAEPDLLFILDSRGISGQFEGSLVQRLITLAEREGRSYMAICRPVEFTTWATVLGFLDLNGVKPAKLVTNAGFVDFTPKKLEVLREVVEQVEMALGPGLATATFLEETTRVNGEPIKLYGSRYSDAYRLMIEAKAATLPTVVINSPLVSRREQFERPRPASFYDALEEANTFNRQLSGVRLVELPEFDRSMTYDAVHHSVAGSALVFENVALYL